MTRDLESDSQRGKGNRSQAVSCKIEPRVRLRRVHMTEQATSSLLSVKTQHDILWSSRSLVGQADLYRQWNALTLVVDAPSAKLLHQARESMTRSKALPVTPMTTSFDPAEEEIFKVQHLHAQITRGFRYMLSPSRAETMAR